MRVGKAPVRAVTKVSVAIVTQAVCERKAFIILAGSLQEAPDRPVRLKTHWANSGQIPAGGEKLAAALAVVEGPNSHPLEHRIAGICSDCVTKNEVPIADALGERFRHPQVAGLSVNLPDSVGARFGIP